MYRIVITNRAKYDLIDIGDYIAYTLMALGTARRFIRGLRKVINSLKEMPQRFGLVDDDDLRSKGIYCLPYKNYYVFYEIVDIMNTVVILRIGYNRRNWKEILIK